MTNDIEDIVYNTELKVFGDIEKLSDIICSIYKYKKIGYERALELINSTKKIYTFPKLKTNFLKKLGYKEI